MAKMIDGQKSLKIDTMQPTFHDTCKCFVFNESYQEKKEIKKREENRFGGESNGLPEHDC